MNKLLAIAIITTTIFVCSAMISMQRVYAEENFRHTPGFPENTPRILEDLITKLLKELSTDLPRLTESFQSDTTVRDVIERINSTYPREILNRAMQELAEGRLTESSLYTYLDLIQNWYKQVSSEGINVTEDYLLAMRALMMLASQSGYVNTYSNIAEQVYEMLMRLSINKGKEPLIGTDISYTGNRIEDIVKLLPPELHEPFPGIPSLEVSLPSSIFLTPSQEATTGLKLPSFPSIPIPRISLSIEHLYLISTLIAVITITVFMLKNRELLSRIVLPLHTRKERYLELIKPGEKSTLPTAVHLYWQAVNYISTRYGVLKYESTTHREYLEVTRNKLSMLKQKVFTELTYIYELARYSGVLDPSLDEKAVRAYQDLVYRVEY